MSETAAVDEPDATLVTDIVYNETNSGKKIIFVAQMVVILILLTFCTLKLSVTKLSCQEISVWFSILSGLVGYILPNPRIGIK